jgi:hypothetical protein
MPDGVQKDALREVIVAAIALADDQRRHLVGALLSEALDALDPGRQAPGG